MSTRKELLQSIAHTVADYRVGEMPTPTSSHVEKWIGQFPASVQDTLLTEIDFTLSRTYLPKATVEGFLTMVVGNPKIAGTDPCAFWRGVTFLNIQGGGQSQRDMLALFGAALQKQCGYSVEQCGRGGGTTFIYLDDVIFTGNRVLKDLSGWIASSAPSQAHVHVITMGLHSGGEYYGQGRIAEAAKTAGKSITLTWWRSIDIEDRKTYTDTSDVLRPTVIPSDPATQAYIKSLSHAPVLRQPGNVGNQKFFSNEAGRHLLEQELLKTGVHVRSICPNLGVPQRPLGNTPLQTPGFGSLIVTFRNCPNNAPLALWAGNPWYPLFARRTN